MASIARNVASQTRRTPRAGRKRQTLRPRRLRTAKDDLPRHRVHRLGRRLDHRARGEIALGDPGSVVEEPRRLVERRHVEFDDRRTEPCQAPERFVVSGGGRVVAENCRWSGFGTPSRKPRGISFNAPRLRRRECASAASGPAMAASAANASSTVSASTETQSSCDRPAPRPRSRRSPRLGFSHDVAQRLRLYLHAGANALQVRVATTLFNAVKASGNPLYRLPTAQDGTDRPGPAAPVRSGAGDGHEQVGRHRPSSAPASFRPRPGVLHRMPGRRSLQPARR